MTELILEDDGLTLRLGRCSIQGWRPRLWVDGQAQVSEQLALEPSDDTTWRLQATFCDGRLRLDGCAQLQQRPHALLLLDATITNHSDRSIALGRAEILSAGRVEIPGPPEALVHLPRAGVIQPRMVRRFASEDCPRTSKIKALFHNPHEPAALLVGFDTFGRCDTVVETDADEQGRLNGLRATCDFGGWSLSAGASTPLERLSVSADANPYVLLEGWADRAAEACTPRPRQWEDVPVGWLGWAWVDAFNVENYEEVMLRNCRAIRERLPGHDIRYIWLSIGNLGDGSPGAWLDWNYRNFPSGPEGLVNRLRELGFRLGLWCGPFYICSAMDESVASLEADGALLRRDGERMVVCPTWRYGRFGEMAEQDRPCIYALDPSHPRSQDFIHEVFATYRRWGIRYYMIDFLNAGAGSVGPHPYDACYDTTRVPGPEAYRDFLRVIRQACGDDTYLLSSSGPTIHNAGIVDAVRTGNDFGEGRQINPNSFFYPASYVINHEGFWTGPLYALRNQACSYYTHRKLYINDSGNVLTLDSPLPLEDARVHAAIHTFGASPTMIGDDVDRMAQDRLTLLRQTLPRPREVAFPVDLFDTPAPDHPKVFQRTNRRPWGRFDVVAVYNFSDDVLSKTLTWQDLSLDQGPHHAWEFWNQQYLGTFADEVTLLVPPHAVRILRLTPDHGQPTVIGTDMHLLMGEMEILEVAWNSEAMTLEGRAWRPRGESGHVFVHAPAGLAVSNPRGLWIAKDGRNQTLILKVPLDFNHDEGRWNIAFSAAQV